MIKAQAALLLAFIYIEVSPVNKYWKMILRIMGIVLSAGFLMMNYTSAFSELRQLPDEIYIKEGQDFTLLTHKPFKVSTNDTAFVALNNGETLRDVMGSDAPASIEISLFGLIPVKNIELYVREDTWVIPGGQTIGVSLYTKGTLVVGTVEVMREDGTSFSPAAAAGIKPGDYIIKLGNTPIDTAEDLMGKALDHEPLEVELDRNGERITTTIQPVKDGRDGEFRLGIWVRDSTMGIGTLSFCDSTLGWYGGLGHAIIDIDTNTPLTVREGKIVEADIIDIIAGEEGDPGELRGTFYSGSTIYGDILKNTEYGIYGHISHPISNDLYPCGIQLAYPEEAHEGSAEILSTLGEDRVHAFSCEIIKVNPQNAPEPKGLVIEITDPLLLEKTGGIVQGMSGSPLIQDGKLIGVVTHVFVNDPTKGYCMYALWMKKHMR